MPYTASCFQAVERLVIQLENNICSYIVRSGNIESQGQNKLEGGDAVENDTHMWKFGKTPEDLLCAICQKNQHFVRIEEALHGDPTCRHPHAIRNRGGIECIDIARCTFFQ